MARLTYTMITSLDGYVADHEGRFDWAMPSDEEHAFVNDLEGGVCTYLYGRRMYETMMGWETDPSFAEASPVARDFARIWRSADKIIYSRTLTTVPTTRARIEREFDPQAVARLKASADRDLLIGGPNLAAHAIRAGLVDEYHFFVAPVIVGSGTRALPDDLRVTLRLRDERRFGNGVVYVRYAAT